MKRIILVLLVAMLNLATYAKADKEGIAFTHGTWKEIKASAKKEKKLIFIDCYTSWCGPCKKMEKEIFPLERVGDLFNENMINYKLDMEKGEGINLAKKYYVGAYPTFLWLDYKGNLVHRVVGYKNAEDFLIEANKALNGGNYDKNLEENYKKNSNDPYVVKEYLEYLVNSADSRSTELAKHYLSIIPKEDYTTDFVFQLLSKISNDAFSNAFQYAMKHREVYNEKFGKATVDVMVANVCYRQAKSLTNPVKDGKPFDKKRYNSFLEVMDKFEYESRNEYAQDILVEVLKNQQDWSGYVDKVNSLITDTTTYKELVFKDYIDWYKPVLESDCDDAYVLEQALSWVNTALDINAIAQIDYIKEYWEDKISILERMDGKAKELEKTRIELALLERLQEYEQRSKRELEETKKALLEYYNDESE